MFGQTNAFSSIINQHFKAGLVEVDYRNFYLFQVNPEHEERGKYLSLGSIDGDASFLFKALDFTV
jgi:hypothetical protein